MTTLACSVCGLDHATNSFQRDGFQIAACPRCSHRFVCNPPTFEQLDDAYGEAYYRTGATADADGVASKAGYQDYLAKADKRLLGFRQRAARLARFTAPGSLLEIGCAVGLFLVAARDAGWRAVGYERSAWAAAYGRQHYGLDIVIADGSVAPFEPSSFDVVAMWDVLEHVLDPAQIIASARDWLRPQGLLVLSTVNAGSLAARLAGERWRHLAPPHHLQYFSRRSLRHLLATHGFDLVEEVASGIFLEQTPDRPFASRLAPALNQLVGHWRLRPLVSRLNLLDELDIVAQRTD